MEEIYSGPKYITVQEVIDAKKVADKWGLPDPYPHISVWMDREWLKFKYNQTTNNERGWGRMSGWKTKLGGVGLICSGIGLVISGLLSEPISGEMLGAGFVSISAGFGMLGIGHKIEKTKV